MTSPIPAPSIQQQRANWDLLLLDFELRHQHLRQLKPFEPLPLLAILGAAAAILGGAAGALFAYSLN